MSPLARRAALLAALLVTTACADRTTPVEPTQPPHVAVSAAASGQQARNERLARRFALALRDDDFRVMVLRSLRSSAAREGKVHLQRFLDGTAGAMRHQLAILSNEPQQAVDADLQESPAIEIYLPVPEHRNRWRGGLDVWWPPPSETGISRSRSTRRAGAFARRRPAAQHPRHRPGSRGVSVRRGGAPILRWVHDLRRGHLHGDGTSGGSGTGGGGTASVVSPGLYMTYAKYNETFEGWLKGDPEFEVHVLGQDGSSSAMKSYQCAGEKAGAPYQYDQNGKEWSGSVMLYSQTQLDGYKAQHPGQAVRLLVVEDDDGACVIKTDSARVTRMFQAIASTYGVMSGGKDTTLLAMKLFKKAQSLFQIFKSAWSVITTQDDLVGNAMEDVAAQAYFPGANWIVRGENSVANGALRLEMH
jgi:hypothetical protein